MSASYCRFRRKAAGWFLMSLLFVTAMSGCQPLPKTDTSHELTDPTPEAFQTDRQARTTLTMHKIDAAIANEDWPQAWSMLRQLEIHYGQPEFVSRLGDKMVLWSSTIDKGVGRTVTDIMYKTDNVLRLTQQKIEQKDYFYSYLLTKRLAQELRDSPIRNKQVDIVEAQLAALAELIDEDAIVYYPDYVFYPKPGAEVQWRQAMPIAERILESRRTADTLPALLGIRILVEDPDSEGDIGVRASNLNLHTPDRRSSSQTISPGSIIWVESRAHSTSPGANHLEISSRQHQSIRLPMDVFEADAAVVLGEVFLPRYSANQLGQIQIHVAAEEGMNPAACSVTLRHPNHSEITYPCRHVGQGRYLSDPVPAGQYRVSVSGGGASSTASSTMVWTRPSQVNSTTVRLFRARTVDLEMWYRLTPTEQAWTKTSIASTTHGNRSIHLMRSHPEEHGGHHGPPILQGNLNGSTERDLSVNFHNFQYFSYEELDAETLSDDIAFPDQLQSVMRTHPLTIPISEGKLYALRMVLHRGMFRPSGPDEESPQHLEVLMHVRAITKEK